MWSFCSLSIEQHLSQVVGVGLPWRLGRIITWNWKQSSVPTCIWWLLKSCFFSSSNYSLFINAWLYHMQRMIAAFRTTPTSISSKIPITNAPNVSIPLLTAITRFSGFPIGVAEEPMLALEASERKKSVRRQILLTRSSESKLSQYHTRSKEGTRDGRHQTDPTNQVLRASALLRQ